jgi:DNA-binding SARP family transcriptional activator
VSPALITAGSRYQFVTSLCELDLARYRHIALAAGAARVRGNSPEAWDLYDAALAILTDDPVADIEILQASPVLTGLRAHHANLVSEYAEDASHHGKHARVLAHLLALTQRDPYDERAHACLMIALTGTGHTGAALAAYDRIRARLDTDLGIAPGPYLTNAQARILRGTIAHGLRP